MYRVSNLKTCSISSLSLMSSFSVLRVELRVVSARFFLNRVIHWTLHQRCRLLPLRSLPCYALLSQSLDWTGRRRGCMALLKAKIMSAVTNTTMTFPSLPPVSDKRSSSYMFAVIFLLILSLLLVSIFVPIWAWCTRVWVPTFQTRTYDI